jgi:putative phosphoribosyl transferase
MYTKSTGEISRCVRISADDVFLLGDLQLPEESEAVVLFAHDGRCQNSPRSRHVARILRENGIGTLLCDLLTAQEAAEDDDTEAYRHDAVLLAKRLTAVTKWVTAQPDTKGLRLGYFGASAGGAAALIAAARMGRRVGAVVSRGGRLDLAVHVVPRVTCPTLLVVGEDDAVGIELNKEALPRLGGEKDLRVVPGASHLFGEPGKLQTMAVLGAQWFCRHLGGAYPHA